MPVMDLRNELKARGINSKGLKSQLIAKLSKALKAEAEKSDDSKDAAVEIEADNVEEKKTEVNLFPNIILIFYIFFSFK